MCLLSYVNCLRTLCACVRIFTSVRTCVYLCQHVCRFLCQDWHLQEHARASCRLSTWVFAYLHQFCPHFRRILLATCLLPHFAFSFVQFQAFCTYSCTDCGSECTIYFQTSSRDHTVYKTCEIIICRYAFNSIKFFINANNIALNLTSFLNYCTRRQ